MENILTVNDLRGTVWKISDSFNLEIAGYTTHLNTSDINNTQSYIKLINENYQGERYELDIAPYKGEGGWEDCLIGLDWTGRNGIATANDWYFIGLIKGATLYFSPNLPENYLIDGGSFLTWLKQYGTLIDTIRPTLSSLFKDITNALREKQGTTELIKHLDIASKIRNLGGGGVEINGNVETYECLEPITAGDFAEITNNISQPINGLTSSTIVQSPLVLLEHNKIFFLRRTSNYETYGVLAKIDGITITTTSKLISSKTNGNFDCIKLEDNKIFVLDSYNGTFVTIVEINEMEITISTTEIETLSTQYKYSCVLVEPNKVFVAYSNSSSYYLYGAIIKIENNEFKVTYTQLDTNSRSCYGHPVCILLEPNKIFIVSRSVSNTLRGNIIEVNDTELIMSSWDNLSYASDCTYEFTPAVLLEPNKIFVCHSYYSTRLYGTIIEINGTTMNYTNNIIRTDFLGGRCYCTLIEPNKVFVTYQYTNQKYLYGDIVDIDGTNSTSKLVLKKEEKDSSNTNSCCAIGNNRVFIIDALNSYDLNTTLFLGENKVFKFINRIKGVAKTSGTIGETIEVYVPKEAN